MAAAQHHRGARRSDGHGLWFALSAQDITAQKRVEQNLHDLTAALTERAVRDPLTGLANRTLLEERLRGALARDARTGSRTGLLFLDLDGFKAVNDRHGHAVGDAVLRQVAQRLLRTVRPSDTVARLGGDEFVVLVEGLTDEGLEPLGGRLDAALRAPVDVAPEPGGTGLTVSVGVSVGTATSSGGDADAAGLLARADAAMYAVKRGRRVDPGPDGRPHTLHRRPRWWPTPPPQAGHGSCARTLATRRPSRLTLLCSGPRTVPARTPQVDITAKRLLEGEGRSDLPPHRSPEGPSSTWQHRRTTSPSSRWSASAAAASTPSTA